MKFFGYIHYFYVLFSLSVGLYAQTHTWTGNANDMDWFNSANWDTGTVPSLTSDVLIQNTSTVEISSASAMANSIELAGNTTLRIVNNISISGDLAIPEGSTIVWYAGTIDGGGTINNDGSIQLETFDEKILNNTTINNNGAIYITQTNLNRATNGATINNNSTGFIEVNSVGGWTQSEPGCTINNAGLIKKINDGSTFSTFYLSFDINNSGTIQAEKDQTFLILGGSIGLSNQETGVLSGSGIFDITANFTNNGFISPGDPPGIGTLEVANNFSFPPNSTLQLDIEGPNPGEFDVAAIFGFPVLEGNIVVNLHYAPEIGDEFEVITANDITACNLADTLTALFDGVEYTFQIECNTTNVILRVIDSSLGLDELSSERLNLSIYPNPVKEEATISIYASEAFLGSIETCDLDIYNLLGQKVKSIVNLSEEKITIKRNGFNSGLYFIKLSSNGILYDTTKIIFE